MPALPSLRLAASLTLGILLSLGAGCSKEDAAFRAAQEANTIEAYEGYLKEYPNTTNQVAVEETLDQLYYDAATKEKTEEAYKAYLEHFPKGKHAPKMQGEYEQVMYKKAMKAGDTASIQAFLQAFPNGNFTAKAQKRYDELTYFTSLSVSDVKVEKINMQGDRRGEMNGWQITGAITNAGAKGVKSITAKVGPKGGEGVEVTAGPCAPGEKVTFEVKTEHAPEGWDESTVAVDYTGVIFGEAPAQ